MLFIFIHVAMATTHTWLNYQKPTFVLLICLLPFLATKGSRVLEKKLNETQVSNTVFTHLKGAMSWLNSLKSLAKIFQFCCV